MRVFTITTYPSMPGRYKVVGPAGRGSRAAQRDTNDPGEAAAQALDWALASPTPYVIIGKAEALNMVPPNLRSRS